MKDKQEARQKLADRLSAAEVTLGERRAVAERLAMAGAADTQLDQVESDWQERVSICLFRPPKT
jgi:hypothetical protein